METGSSTRKFLIFNNLRGRKKSSSKLFSFPKDFRRFEKADNPHLFNNFQVRPDLTV